MNENSLTLIDIDNLKVEFKKLDYGDLMINLYDFNGNLHMIQFKEDEIKKILIFLKMLYEK